MITILFLSANPANTQPLELIKECNRIDEEIRFAAGPDKFNFKQHHEISLDELRKQILLHKPQIIHFSGHGSEESELIFMGKDGQVQTVPQVPLSKFFEILNKDNDISTVFLNACYSEGQAKAISKHVEFVIGMSRAISDEAAIIFAVSFYSSLAFGKSVEDSFELAKVDLQFQKIPEEATPVLLKKEGTSPSKSIIKTSAVLEDLHPTLETSTSNIVNRNVSYAGEKISTIQIRKLSFTGEKRLFIGRDDYLKTKIKNALKEPGSRVSLVGPGGSGKSQLAFKALHQYYEKDKIIDFVVPIYLAPYSLIETRTDGSTNIITNINFRKFLNDIGTYLITNGISSLTKQQFEELDINECKTTISEIFSNKKHSLIYCDNFETISLSEYEKENQTKETNDEINKIFYFLNNELPNNTSILVTSRNIDNHLTLEQNIDVLGLDIDDGIELFIKYASPYSRHLENSQDIKLQNLLKTIINKTGGHPFSIEIFAKTYKGGGNDELKSISNSLGEDRVNPYEPDERLKSLHNSFSYSINTLSPELKRLFPLLTLFLSPFPSKAIEEIFIDESTPQSAVNLYNKSLLSRIDSDQKGMLGSEFWLYSIQPALRNYLEERYKNDISKLHSNVDFVANFYNYYQSLIQDTYGAWGTEPENHTNFMRRFDLITATEGKNDFDQAIEFADNFGTFDKKQRKREKAIAADICTHLGLIYWKLGQYDKSVLYHKKALGIHTELNDRVGMTRDYTNFGLVCSYKGQYDEALSYYKKALVINEELNDRVILATNYHNIGIAYHNKEEYDDALTYYNKTLKINDELDNRLDLVTNYIDIGEVLLVKKDKDKAKKAAANALEVANEFKKHTGTGTEYPSKGLIDDLFKKINEYND